MKIDANIHAMAHQWKAVNADTGEQIQHAVWADEEARQVCIYQTGPNGSVEKDVHGYPMTEILNVNVRLVWVGGPDVPMHIRMMER